MSATWLMSPTDQVCLAMRLPDAGETETALCFDAIESLPAGELNRLVGAKVADGSLAEWLDELAHAANGTSSAPATPRWDQLLHRFGAELDVGHVADIEALRASRHDTAELAAAVLAQRSGPLERRVADVQEFVSACWAHGRMIVPTLVAGEQAQMPRVGFDATLPPEHLALLVRHDELSRRERGLHAPTESQQKEDANAAGRVYQALEIAAESIQESARQTWRNARDFFAAVRAVAADPVDGLPAMKVRSYGQPSMPDDWQHRIDVLGRRLLQPLSDIVMSQIPQLQVQWHELPADDDDGDFGPSMLLRAPVLYELSDHVRADAQFDASGNLNITKIVDGHVIPSVRRPQLPSVNYVRRNYPDDHPGPKSLGEFWKDLRFLWNERYDPSFNFRNAQKRDPQTRYTVPVPGPSSTEQMLSMRKSNAQRIRVGFDDSLGILGAPGALFSESPNLVPPLRMGLGGKVDLHVGDDTLHIEGNVGVSAELVSEVKLRLARLSLTGTAQDFGFGCKGKGCYRRIMGNLLPNKGDCPTFDGYVMGNVEWAYLRAYTHTGWSFTGSLQTTAYAGMELKTRFMLVNRVPGVFSDSFMTVSWAPLNLHAEMDMPFVDLGSYGYLNAIASFDKTWGGWAESLSVGAIRTSRRGWVPQLGTGDARPPWSFDWKRPWSSVKEQPKISLNFSHKPPMKTVTREAGEFVDEAKEAWRQTTRSLGPAMWMGLAAPGF